MNQEISRSPSAQAPAQAERMHGGLNRASENMQQKAQQLREAKDEWIECLRIAVRENPLATVAAALAIGALIMRLGR